MAAKSSTLLDRTRRLWIRRGVRASVAAVTALTASACGIGKLDRGGEHQDQGSRQIKAVEDAYASKNKQLALPKGGPGKGTPPKALARRSDAGPGAGGDNEPKSFKLRVAEFLRLRAPRKRVAVTEEGPPERLRGIYTLGDDGDFFVPCGDTVRYSVKGTTEAIYLMQERMRFIVRGLKSPVYAVFTATFLKPEEQAPGKVKAGAAAKDPSKDKAAPASTPKPGQPIRAAVKAIYVTKVDTLTTAIPASCKTYSSGSRATGVNPEDGDLEASLDPLQFGRRRVVVGRFASQRHHVVALKPIQPAAV